MSENQNELPIAIKKMSEDLGIDQSQFQSMGFSDIFKDGHTTALALTRIGHVYNLNAQNNEKIEELKNTIKDLNSQLITKNNEVIALQKTNNLYEKKLLKLSSSKDNSNLATILFGFSSIPIGVCGSMIASKDYSGATVFGIAGLILYIFATYLLNSHKDKESNDE